MGEGGNVIEEKAFCFSLRIINMYKILVAAGEFVLSKQILRSGTSIGANISESVYAESEPDFIHKLSISRKEANETKYWLELLYRGNYIPENGYNSMMGDCIELIKILTAIILSTKKRIIAKK